MKDKDMAIALLAVKDEESWITFDYIASQTGYSKRQLIRMSKNRYQGTMTPTASHPNPIPHNKASGSEIEYLVQMKAKYPDITIAQFRDIYIEDVIYNSDKAAEVFENQLKPRSYTWFRNLFRNLGWESIKPRKTRKRDNRAAHPLREPSPQRGMIIQIDGTPYDWLHTGENWTLHLAVDDATTEVLAGWFFPTERQLGYCIIMRKIILEHGIPEAIYSDKHTIFKSKNEYGITQFGMMMNDLGITMLYANTAPAKGRVERYNGTLQGRLPNDIIRFGIRSYDELNTWVNDFYIKYINRKFSFRPKSEIPAFVEFDPSTADLNWIFSLRVEKTIKNDMFSFENKYYCLYENEDSTSCIHVINGTKIKVRYCVFNSKVYAYRSGLKYVCKVVAERRRSNSELLENAKDVLDYLSGSRK